MKLNRKLLPVPFVYILYLFIFMCGCSKKITNVPFDKTKWQSGDIKTRGAMVRDILDSKLLIGKSANEIIILLGEPDYKRTDKYNYWVYKVQKYDSSIKSDNPYQLSNWPYNLKLFLKDEKVEKVLLVD